MGNQTFDVNGKGSNELQQTIDLCMKLGGHSRDEELESDPEWCKGPEDWYCSYGCLVEFEDD